MKKIRLAHPADNSKISLKNPRLQWEPVRGLTWREHLSYTLTIYATRRGRRPGRRTKPLPVFKTKVLKRNFFDLPIRDKGLKTGRTYWWQILAQNKDGQVVAISEKRRFKIKDLRVPVTDIVAEGRIPHSARYVVPENAETGAAVDWLSQRENLLPYPPVAWGKPVKLRWRSELGSGTSEPDPPGTVDPIAMVWGNEAGEMYLPPYLVEHANLYWDLSHIDGCERVLLQVSGEDGFSEPNDGDVMEDANVINFYWGPPRLTCGANEVETQSGGPPRGELILASDLDLLSNTRDDEPVQPPSEFHPEVVRQIRTIPCNESREQIDLASDPVTVRCVRYPVIDIITLTLEHTWGDNPGRVFNFTLMFEERFPNVRELPPPTAPSTLLIFTPPGPSMMDHSSCSNMSLTMDGEPVESQNRITLLLSGDFFDAYVIYLPEWPSVSGYDFRMEQQWNGGITHNSLWDFLDPNLTAVVIPGVHPSWLYCEGVFQDYDSLYGREDLPDESTNSPFYYHIARTGRCLHGDLVGTWSVPTTGITNFNDFMENTFRGTRTVTHDDRVGEYFLDEPPGTQEVEVRFYTENTNDLRYVMPTLTEPVMMREIRSSGEVLWKVKYMDGKYATLYATGAHVGVTYSGRRGEIAGRSQFDPPRLQIWLSVRVGRNEGFGVVTADIHYDLTAD